MTRLIDADALAMHMADWQLSASSDQYDTIEEAIDAVTSAPTIDAVPVVRCKDCKWFGEMGCAIEIVDETDMPKENDFCSFGERKDNERLYQERGCNKRNSRADVIGSINRNWL